MNDMQASSPSSDPLSAPEERRVLLAALDSFRKYRQAAHFNLTHVRRQAFYSLTSTHVELLSKPPYSLPKTFDAIDQAIDKNAEIAECIYSTGLAAFGLEEAEVLESGLSKPNDLDKASSTINQIYRDWSTEGSPERVASYSPILRALESGFAKTSQDERHLHRILVPGAGLGRLVFDICAAGFTVEGNEISYHQMLASNYLLNCTRAAGQHELYPFLSRFSNLVHRRDQCRSVAIPDIHPATALQVADENMHAEVQFGERMSMTSGDFCVLYQQPEYHEAFDAIVTCFFIDTAPNLIHYIEASRSCLEPGGLWINLGPLLWHFDGGGNVATVSEQSGSDHGEQQGIGEPGSFELSEEEVIALIEHHGFRIIEQDQCPAGATGYIQDPNSMLQNVYRPAFWTARKM